MEPIRNWAEYSAHLHNERLFREQGAVPLGSLKKGRTFRLLDSAVVGTVLFVGSCGVTVRREVKQERTLTYQERETGEMKTITISQGPKIEHWSSETMVLACEL
jgi:hypothetical protein